VLAHSDTAETLVLPGAQEEAATEEVEVHGRLWARTLAQEAEKVGKMGQGRKKKKRRLRESAEEERPREWDEEVEPVTLHNKTVDCDLVSDEERAVHKACWVDGNGSEGVACGVVRRM
jgi:hypothetical protein